VIEGDVAVSKHFVDVFALCRSRKHFADVFKVFVPRGNGCIQMHTAESGDIENAREEDPAETPADTEQLTEAQGNRVASFKGVQVKVSFTGGVKGEQFFYAPAVWWATGSGRAGISAILRIVAAIKLQSKWRGKLAREEAARCKAAVECRSFQPAR
jgi:hypothetical protein